MPKQAAGLLVYRIRENQLEVFLVHPGGPFWAKKDDGAWSIPKGEFEASEEPLAAALREFTEETGLTIRGPFSALGTVRQTSGKLIYAFAAASAVDAARIVSNTFKIEWPPRSGRWAEFPEVDRAAWFTLEAAATKIHAGQAPLLSRLNEMTQRAKH